MNLLILNWKDIKNPDVGGAEIILYEFCKRLVADGHQVTWFSRKFSGCKTEEVMSGVKILRRGNKLTVYPNAWLYYLGLSVKPDLVLDCVNTLCWQTPLYVPEKRRIAYVNQLAKEVFFYELPFGLAQIAYLLESVQFVSYKKTKFICYSPSVANDVAGFGIPDKNIRTFSMGLDHSRYRPGRKSATPLFVFVARLVNMKRADLCVEAILQVKKVYKTVKLAIIGYGPQENRLKKLIRKLDLTDNVIIVNKDNLYFERNVRDVKVHFMQHAWGLILPSVKEGWGMVVTEAAACGTPSIVSNVTGLRDSVIDRKTGIILSNNPGVKELSAAIISLIDDKAMRNGLSKQAALWSNQFNWEKSYRSFLQLIV